jgi:hypothetical protein
MNKIDRPTGNERRIGYPGPAAARKACQVR